MAQVVARKSLRFVFGILLLDFHGNGQASPPGTNQTATNSECANIVALAGNVSVNCSDLTPVERRLINSIPAVLNKILANQLDPNAVMKKLDEILHAVNPNSTKRTYLLTGGTREVYPGGISSNNAPLPAFNEILERYNAKNWAALIQVCERAMKDTPDWFTPYAYAGQAYAALGQKEKAIALLEVADQGMAGNPDYGNLPAGVKRLLDELRSE